MNRSPQHRQYNAVQIKTANKGQLIVLLYQGALKNMKKALLQLEEEDMEGKGNSLIKAQDIVLELMYALDQGMLDEGNELAANLQRLYLYCYRQLVQANLKMDPKPIGEVIELLANLLEAWEQVAAGGGPDDGGSARPTVALTG
ncbi:MAG: flagellar export chaperone FliS [Gemmatimonadetes bacterium]|nr:flagellar export chaperone FliS [Gemmatimonadota bacterium]